MQLSPDRIGNARAVLIAGPTASGKSAAALWLAEAAVRQGRGVIVVNADSMQVYDALQILTARPDVGQLAAAPHRLYGHVAAERRYSVGAWLGDVGPVLEEAKAAGVLPVLVGGTGLYFKALTEGLAATPAVPAEIRARWAERLAAEGSGALHALLIARDAAAAAAIKPSDPQRILRALEVHEATGRPLAAWQAGQAAPLPPASDIVRIVLEPDRAILYRRIEDRFDRMIAEGALDEVRALLDCNLPATLPVMKAIGVREIAAFLRDEIPLEDAVATAKMETRRYAKRQTTWFRNQMRDWERLVA